MSPRPSSSMLAAAVALVAAAAVVPGCSRAPAPEAGTAAPDERAELRLTVDDGTNVFEVTGLSVPVGTGALAAMRESVEVEAEGGFVTSIRGVRAPAGSYWKLSVNGETAEFGIDRYEVGPGGLELAWTLEAIGDYGTPAEAGGPAPAE